MACFTLLVASSAIVNEAEETSVDWIGFVAQAGGGLIIGAVVAMVIFSHGFLFNCACGLFGAGLGGYWGDRLWFSLTNVQGDLPRRHSATTAICIALILAGGGLTVASIYSTPEVEQMRTVD